MIRAAFCALALTAAATPPASAQDLPLPPRPDAAEAQRALSAMWRPLPAMTGEAITQACAGAEEEIEAVEAALPPVLTAESVARVRALRGLLVIPTDDPAVSYFFPDRRLSWFASGLGAIAVLNQQQGLLAIRDSGGHEFAIQLGTAGGHPILRISPPEAAPSQDVLTFVGCAPTWGL